MVKDAPVDELAAAIRWVVAGERVVDRALAASAIGKTSTRNRIEAAHVARSHG